MLYKDLTLGGNVANYDKENELLRFKVKPETLPMQFETFTIHIGNIRNSGAVISLLWDKTKVPMQLEVNYDSKVMAQIEQQMANPMSSAANLYATSATYYLNENKDMEQALEWIDAAIEINDKAFWNIHTKAQILSKLGRYDKAIETAKLSMEKAKANEGGDFGYVIRNEKAIAEWKKLQ